MTARLPGNPIDDSRRGKGPTMVDRMPSYDPDDEVVPHWNPVEESVQGIGEAGADVVSDKPDGTSDRAPDPAANRAPDRAGSDTPEGRRGPVTDPAEATGSGRPGDVGGDDEPWGTASGAPLNEGSDDSAVPDVDPAERRLSGR
jgi:hypothetical protein